MTRSGGVCFHRSQRLHFVQYRCVRRLSVELVSEMIYRVRTTEPLSPTDGSPFGARQYWQGRVRDPVRDRRLWF